MAKFVRLFRLTFLLSFAALSACQTIRAGPDPVVPITDTNFNAIRQAIQTRCLDLNMQTASEGELQTQRNDLVTAYMLAADMQYGRYESNLLEEVRNNNFAAALSILILSSTAGVIGDRDLARGFTTATGIIAGGQKAYTTDQLLNETVSVLQQQMRASRAAQRALILSKLGQPYVNWTFCLAFQDAQAYERAGTLNAALAEISASASQARRTNEANADAVATMLPYERNALAVALREFTFPADRNLWTARRQIVFELVQDNDLLPQPNSTVPLRVARILNGSSPEMQAARQQLARAIIADPRTTPEAKAALERALAQ